MALSGPPWTRGSPCSSPAMPSTSTWSFPCLGNLLTALKVSGRVYVVTVPVSSVAIEHSFIQYFLWVCSLGQPLPRRKPGLDLEGTRQRGGVRVPQILCQRFDGLAGAQPLLREGYAAVVQIVHRGLAHDLAEGGREGGAGHGGAGGHAFHSPVLVERIVHGNQRSGQTGIGQASDHPRIDVCLVGVIEQPA